MREVVDFWILWYPLLCGPWETDHYKVKWKALGTWEAGRKGAVYDEKQAPCLLKPCQSR